MSKSKIREMVNAINESELLNIHINFIEEIGFYIIELEYKDKVKRISLIDFIDIYNSLVNLI